MVTGLELMLGARFDFSTVETAAIMIDGDIRVVTPIQLPDCLERMAFNDDPQTSGGDICPDGRRCSFRIWTADRIWYIDGCLGYARVTWDPRSPEDWVKDRLGGTEPAPYKDVVTSYDQMDSTGRKWVMLRESGESDLLFDLRRKRSKSHKTQILDESRPGMIQVSGPTKPWSPDEDEPPKF